MSRLRILIAENDDALGAYYAQALDAAGYNARVVKTGQETLLSVRDWRPALLLLDIGLDGRLDGFDVLRAMRRRSDRRVVVLTCRGDTQDIVRGLELGADNYLVKPAPHEELVARVQAELRYVPRTGGREPGAEQAFRFGDLVIDLERREVIRGSRRSVLAVGEAALLTRLLQTPGEVVPDRELLRVGWGYDKEKPDVYDYNAIAGHIHRLRLKIERSPGRPRLIIRVRGAGYYFAAPPAAQE